MKPLILSTGILLSIYPLKVSALNINLNPTAGMDPNAIAGFQSAANYWQSVLIDDADVNINIDFTALDPGVLGQASSTTQSFSVFDYFKALRNDATSPTDATATANLQTLSEAGGLTYATQIYNSETEAMEWGIDNDDSGNNRVLNLNTANIKALDPDLLGGNVDDPDASITFSSEFSWDFDNSDGIDAGKQDFVGVAIHEIGHSLGFTSGVDTVDYVIDHPQSLENLRVWSGLDMFRYSAQGALDLSAGADSYLSIDGGETNLAPFSTGSSNGDGHQASHWKDNQITGIQLGIMDPTALPAGNANEVTDLDLQAFDIIGWDLAPVPEPSTSLLIFATSLIWLGKRKRP
jgi:hypothetical protein